MFITLLCEVGHHIQFNIRHSLTNTDLLFLLDLYLVSCYFTVNGNSTELTAQFNKQWLFLAIQLTFPCHFFSPINTTEKMNMSMLLYCNFFLLSFFHSLCLSLFQANSNTNQVKASTSLHVGAHRLLFQII